MLKTVKIAQIDKIFIQTIINKKYLSSSLTHYSFCHSCYMNDRLEMENKERSKDLSIRQHSRFSTQSSEKCPENTAIAENVTNYLQQHVAVSMFLYFFENLIK